MKTLKKSFLKIFFILLTAAVFSGCSKKEESSNKLNKDSKKVLEEVSWKTEDGHICILFGHGFEEENEENIAFFNLLQKKFGFEEEGGLIIPVFFEKDLNSRIWNFNDFISGKKLKGIIVLGAPANTHKVLSELQDSFEEGIPYNIFSLFPTDNSILGQEMTSNIVIEYELSIEDETEGLDVDQGFNEETSELVLNAIKYMYSLKEVLASSWELEEQVKNITGSRKIRHYVDSLAPIPSMNHFLIKAPLIENKDSDPLQEESEELKENE